ncbi:hypothetical protein [Priestia endophytica]|uniref:hypothetical protein n=1 Tax=Priestia endophytica TaxID=135735 RepID=UPI00124CFC9E|nr:hypothetical protein [Priestia endophytica]KAB2494112.1 hypothetical protein F8155_10795 [Priestia endophytica]
MWDKWISAYITFALISASTVVFFMNIFFPNLLSTNVIIGLIGVLCLAVFLAILQAVFIIIKLIRWDKS